MRRMRGFTLIELMITLAIVSILLVVALPSYRDYIVRGIRTSGQQFLMDLAQRQEQYFLDQRQYASAWVNGTAPVAGELSVDMPAQVVQNYTLTVPLCNAPCNTFTLILAPTTGSQVAGANDGRLVLNNLQQRWRETDGNGLYGTNDCRWEQGSCKPH